MLRSAKARLYDILVETEDGELPDRIVAVFLMLLIFANGVAVILETVDELASAYGRFFFALEAFSVAVFTVEYLLRLWIAPLDPRYVRPFAGRLRFALTPLALIDLLAVLPFYLPMLLALDLRLLRLLRVFRLLRLFKMSRYAQSLNAIGQVFRSKKEELTVTLLLILILLVFSASLMYVIENEAQPEQFSSIPATLWWAVVTLTTIGYGDVYPVTPLGRMLGGFIAFLGIGIFALPTGILATGFADEIRKRRQPPAPVADTCPHCGRETTLALNSQTSAPAVSSN